MKTQPYSPPFIEQFHSYYDVDQNGCWVWNKSLESGGYGQVWDGRRKQRAHRLSYRLFVGEIPHGLHIDHLCRNRACVNPAHLEPVTMAENNRRSMLIPRRPNKRLPLGPPTPKPPKPRRTACINGHEYTPETAYIHAVTGIRYCRICNHDAQCRVRERRRPQR